MVEARELEADTKEFLPKMLEEREDSLAVLERRIDVITDGRARLKELCARVDEANAEQRDFRALLEELRQAKAQLEKATSHSKELNVPLSYEHTRHKELWERCMGVEFRLTEDRAISVVFRHLWTATPQQCCTVTLDVDENNKWTVVHLEPALHGLSPLLRDLNQTGNFSKFLKEVRRKFKDCPSDAT